MNIQRSVVRTPQPNAAQPLYNDGEGAMTRKQIQELLERRTEAEQRVADVAGRRRAYALPASQGDKKAVTALQKLNEEHVAAALDVSNLDMALETAEAQHKEAMLEARQRDADRRFQDATRIGQEICDGAVRIDMTLAELTKEFRAQRDRCRELRKTGIGDNVGKIMSPTRAIFACRHHGLREFIHFDPAGNNSHNESMAAMTEGLVKNFIRRPDVTGLAA